MSFRGIISGKQKTTAASLLLFLPATADTRLNSTDRLLLIHQLGKMPIYSLLKYFEAFSEAISSELGVYYVNISS